MALRQFKYVCLASAAAFFGTEMGIAFAQMDEIIVQARKREETLQNVPVTVAALGEADLDRFQINTISEVANFVPNFQIQQGGSGSGGTLRLRGVGSSAISAAFDSAIAINVDGVIANTMRLVQNSFLDIGQVEVLKGPQSLFFGKSASAGVISFRSNDPTDEFEVSGKASYEFEEKGIYTEAIVSGPITDTIGARYAIGYTDRDEILKNTAPGVQNPERGEQSLDMRATITWDPTENWSTNFKAAYSQYENDGAILFADILCTGATAQGTLYPSGFNPAPGLPSGNNCNAFDEVVQFGDQNPVEAANIPENRGGVPFEEQDTFFLSLRSEYDFTQNMTAVFHTGFYNLDNFQNDCFSYDINGAGCNLAQNTTRSFSQEVRIQSTNLTDWFDFMVGAYYQTRFITFKPFQHALGASLIPTFGPFTFGPDPVTGFTADYLKEHRTETDAASVFGSITLRPIERVEITAGLRYTREQKQNSINVPYVHANLQAIGFTPLQVAGINFDDDNYSPEVSVTYEPWDDIIWYAAYKTGFKSGGIDNSALPTSSLLAAQAAGDFSGLIFQSETSKGFEGGVRTTLLDGSLRWNITGFRYVYKDLQVQQFDPINIQFITLNAGELTSSGMETDALWLSPIEGLTFRGALAYTNSPYTDEFNVLSLGVPTNIDGRQNASNAKWTGNIGAIYEAPIPNTDFVMSASGFAHYTDSYNTADDPLSFRQPSFWRGDAALSIGDADGVWQVALIGQNITNKIYTITSGGRPFADTTAGTGVANTERADQILQNSRGRQVSLEVSLRY